MFRFKQFTICQDRTPMKVGTDGVLLGAWSNLEEAATILDIGTGTGLIALMAAQRNPTAEIDALEIEAAACEQAWENIASSPWPQRVRVYLQALQNYHPDKLYDSIVCNPPFFVDSTPAPDQGRSLARHTHSLTHPELIEHVQRLLSLGGNFCVILPVIEAQQFVSYAEQFHLFPYRITYILPTPDKAPKRWLMEFRRNLSETKENELIIELSRHRYSPDYIDLTRAFYLYF